VKIEFYHIDSGQVPEGLKGKYLSTIPIAIDAGLGLHGTEEINSVDPSKIGPGAYFQTSSGSTASVLATSGRGTYEIVIHAVNVGDFTLLKIKCYEAAGVKVSNATNN
jgi:hypothetical protein